MSEQKYTLEDRMNDTSEIKVNDLLTKEQRKAYINMSDEEAEKFEKEVILPLLEQYLK